MARAPVRAGAPLKIYFDGGCRPNPGRIEVAVVARGQVHYFDDLGEGSSSDAEWLALCKALEVAQGLGEPRFDLLGDNRGVILQASRAAPCRLAAARAHLARFEAAAAALPPRRLRWIPRQQNLAGIALVRRHAAPLRPPEASASPAPSPSVPSPPPAPAAAPRRGS